MAQIPLGHPGAPQDVLLQRHFLDRGQAGLIIPRKDSSGHYDRLNEEEQAVLLVLLFEGEINNGGFDQFFSNSSGELYEDALDGLNRMQAVEAASLCAASLCSVPVVGFAPKRSALFPSSRSSSVKRSQEPGFFQWDRTFRISPRISPRLPDRSSPGR